MSPGPHRRAREAAHVRLVPYAPRYATAFRDLNLAWITRYFAVEPEDRRLLDDPQTHLLNPGGYVVIALHRDRPVGTCALLPLPDDPAYPYELVKMAVDPAAQGLGIGEALGRHVLAKAVALGARAVYLETNPVLSPAVALYRKLGFRDVAGHDSPFARCGLQMAWRHRESSPGNARATTPSGPADRARRSAGSGAGDFGKAHSDRGGS